MNVYVWINSTASAHSRCHRSNQKLTQLFSVSEFKFFFVDLVIDVPVAGNLKSQIFPCLMAFVSLHFQAESLDLYCDLMAAISFVQVSNAFSMTARFLSSSRCFNREEVILNFWAIASSRRETPDVDPRDGELKGRARSIGCRFGFGPLCRARVGSKGFEGFEIRAA